MTEVLKQQRARCEHCGNIQYFREGLPGISGLMYLDIIALCCQNPSYWVVDERNKKVR